MIDPVCGMEVIPEKAAGKTEHQGQTYYFCSEKCLEKFKQNPREYLDEDRKKNGTITQTKVWPLEEGEYRNFWFCGSDNSGQTVTAP